MQASQLCSESRGLKRRHQVQFTQIIRNLIFQFNAYREQIRRKSDLEHWQCLTKNIGISYFNLQASRLARRNNPHCLAITHSNLSPLVAAVAGQGPSMGEFINQQSNRLSPFLILVYPRPFFRIYVSPSAWEGKPRTKSSHDTCLIYFILARNRFNGIGSEEHDFTAINLSLNKTRITNAYPEKRKKHVKLWGNFRTMTHMARPG